MAKRNPDRYVPGNLPNTTEGLIQFLYDELPRISAAINRLPAGVSVKEVAAAIPITTIPTEFRLFEGETPNYDLPGGGWDITLGEWTIPATGLYQLNGNAIVDPFGSGNKDYAATLTLYENDISIFENSAVGDDAFPLAVSMALSGRLQREDVIRMALTVVHDQFVGNTTYTASMSATSTALE